MHEHKIVDYSPQHLKDAGLGSRRAWVAYANYPSWSLFCGSELIVAGGILIPYDTLGEAWAVPGPAAMTHQKLMFQTTKDILTWQLPHGIRRLQALVMADHGAGRRWAEHLGFTEESIMKMYGAKGEDVVMFTLFPGREPWMAD